jgi:hypothetical protein
MSQSPAACRTTDLMVRQAHHEDLTKVLILSLSKDESVTVSTGGFELVGGGYRLGRARLASICGFPVGFPKRERRRR